MTQVLVRIKRKSGVEFYGGDRFARHPRYFGSPRVDNHEDAEPIKQAEFFEVHERDLATAMRQFADQNPGCEVIAYAMTHSAITPPGEFVLKQVTKDGVLPA